MYIRRVIGPIVVVFLLTVLGTTNAKPLEARAARFPNSSGNVALNYAAGPERLITVQETVQSFRSIEDVQRYLKSEGLYSGGINGAWGSGTANAVGDLYDRGSAAWEAGQYREAEEIYRRGLEAAELGLGSEHSATLSFRSSVAVSVFSQGRYAESAAIFRDVLETSERVLGPDHADTLWYLNMFGANLIELGRYAEAESTLRRALATNERVLGPEHQSTLDSANDLAVALFWQDRLADAQDFFRQALEGRERVLGESHFLTLRSASGLAICLAQLGRYSEADVHFRRVLEASERTLGPDHPNTLKNLHDLATNARDLGRPGEAEVLLRRVLEGQQKVLGAEHPTTLRTLRNLANSIGDQRRYSEEADLYRKSFDISARVLGPGHPDTLKALNGLVNSLSRQGRTGEALSVRESGFSALPAYFALGLADVESSGDLLPLDLVRYLEQLAELAPPDAAARSFAVQGWLTYGRLDIALGDLAARQAFEQGPAEAIRELQDAREALEAARAAYLASFEGRGPEVDGATLASNVTMAERAFEVERVRIARDFPALAEIQLPNALTAEEAQALLTHGEGLLAYAQTEDILHAWLVTTDRVAWRQIKLPLRKMVSRVSRLRAALDYSAEPPTVQPDPDCALPAGMAGLDKLTFDLCESRELHDDLLGDFDLTGIEELIVVPDGPLEQLPFSLLVSSTAPDGSPHWLIEDHAISYLPTTSSLRALRQEGISREDIAEKLPYLGIAPVTFGDQTAAPGMRGGQYDLPSTEAEVARISELLDPGRSAVVNGNAASEAFARSTDLSRYGVISFATHAFLSEEARDLTGGAITEPALLLHPGDGEDGFLTASEAATLRLDADWVLLSACNTAAGDAEDAEGLSGLARAFFFAGAKALMVSHWPVEDQSAMALMTETMSRSASGNVSRAQALREAMLTVMNDPDNKWDHPLFWAPFVVVGESRFD